MAPAAVCAPDSSGSTVTAVPTPRGFVALASLSTGDLVFGSDGHPTAVCGTAESSTGTAIEFGFSDGATTLVGAEQLWLAFDAATATEDYYRSIDIATNLAMSDGTARWAVRTAGPVAYPDTGPTTADPLTFGQALRNGLVESESELLPYLLGTIQVRRAVLDGLHGEQRTLPASAPAMARDAYASLVRSLGGLPVVESAGSGTHAAARFGVRRGITAAAVVDRSAPGGLTVAATDGLYLTGGDYVLSCGSWGRS